MSERESRLEELFDMSRDTTYTTENPVSEEEPTPEEVVEHKATVMS